MSTQSKLTEALSVAGQAVDHIRCDEEQQSYLDALFGAILTAAKHDPAMPEVRLRNIEVLAQIGGYLANDWSEFTERRIEELDGQLDDLESRGGEA